MMKYVLTLLFLSAGFMAGLLLLKQKNTAPQPDPVSETTYAIPTLSQEPPAMAIEVLRAREYPATPLTITETLTPGSNYTRFIASYQSDGLTIYGLLTVPNGAKPQNGFPAILFLHGYLPPDSYVTTADYVATQGGLAESGFITYKPDLRGHGKSEGVATGAHFSPDYTIDSLNALAALREFDGVNPDALGLWGHSNGGEIGLRVIEITDEVKAAVFWAGVVGSYRDMLETYLDRITFLKRQSADVFGTYGSPSANPAYWDQIEPYNYLSYISTPIQLHHGNNDSEVPVELSRSLFSALEDAGVTAEFYEYPGADHNMTGTAFSQAMSRTVDFFRKYVK